MFKDVVGYEGEYTINESGIVRNHNGHVLRPAESHTGYLRVALQHNGEEERKNYSVHRLVAQAFIPNPDNLPVVCHKDNDKLNNHSSNLKWATQEENVQDAISDGLWRRNPDSYYKGFQKLYDVYDIKTGHTVLCEGMQGVADTICYKTKSISNMVNRYDHPVNIGPYKGYRVRTHNDKAKPALVFYE